MFTPHRTSHARLRSTLGTVTPSLDVTYPEVTVTGVLVWNVGKPAHCVTHGATMQEPGGNFITTKDGPKDRGITVYCCPDCAKQARARRARA